MALHTNDIYSVALADNEWSQILSENSEAQDLLSNAIAHHEQYREDPKRTTVSHLHHKSDHYGKLNITYINTSLVDSHSHSFIDFCKQIIN